MQHPRLHEIYDALNVKDHERARHLLQEVLAATPNAEVYYLASLIAFDEEERRQFLKTALEYDPFHVKASEAYYRQPKR
jgi:hypothetical protein